MRKKSTSLEESYNQIRNQKLQEGVQGDPVKEDIEGKSGNIQPWSKKEEGGNLGSSQLAFRQGSSNNQASLSKLVNNQQSEHKSYK